MGGWRAFLAIGVAAVTLALVVSERAHAAQCLLGLACPPSSPAPPRAADPATPPPPSPLLDPGSGSSPHPPRDNPTCRPRRRRLPGWFVGAGDVVAADPFARRCTLTTMAAGGVGVVRMSFLWSQMERHPGRYDFDFYDRYVEQLARYRLRILPVLYGTPPPYSAAPNFSHPERAQPRRNREFARFARALVRRWGPGGSLWRHHPDLPYLPIRTWQVWNEPNTPSYWMPRPNARAYVRMLASVSRAIKRVDRRAEVVMGGLVQTRQGIPLESYLRQVYRAGARRWFDSVGLHPYSRTPAGGVAIVQRVRSIMTALGDRRSRIWITEYGWATGGPPHVFRVGESGQARRSRQTLGILWRRRKGLGLRGAVYAFWSDARPVGHDYWAFHVGLYRRDGRPKAAAAAFSRAVRAFR